MRQKNKLSQVIFLIDSFQDFITCPLWGSMFYGCVRTYFCVAIICNTCVVELPAFRMVTQRDAQHVENFSTWRILVPTPMWGISRHRKYMRHSSFKGFVVVVLVWFGVFVCAHVATSGRCTCMQKSRFGDEGQLSVGPASQGNEQHKNGIWDCMGRIARPMLVQTHHNLVMRHPVWVTIKFKWHGNHLGSF